MKQSAGTVLYRFSGDQLEVLLVHPSGNYNRHKPWSIPKGLPDPGESLEDAARRETIEEAGVTAGELTPLGSVEYTKSRKEIHGFAGQAVSGEPHCASWEVDCAEFLPIEQAMKVIHPEQQPLLVRLQEHLAKKGEQAP
jgi:predicted NUDIX family NTP pyrophosphohydrolase